MKIADFYSLGLALSVAQWALGWWTVIHLPAASDTEDTEGLTYRSFLNLTSSGALYSTFGWVLLITMARWKRADPQPRRAGIHFRLILLYTFYRICIVMVGGIEKPAPEFTQLLTRCALGGFRSFTCAPLGALVFLPVVEILIGLSAAFVVRHRAVARHGKEKVEVPPPAPTFAAAWTLGEVMELDHTPVLSAESTIELKV
ncbi:hypothetical protein B0H16DRAFT_1544361 [Mycena metata]|uniref:Uncharacterized protein n=1 Tax=Mycena metata TaxID=1033252 RepID=A0AAD7J106_9AGAR|nr:hypothetical protein B0H16DRAFT_1544361 [Mycena metata]